MNFQIRSREVIDTGEDRKSQRTRCEGVERGHELIGCDIRMAARGTRQGRFAGESEVRRTGSEPIDKRYERTPRTGGS